MDAVRSGAGFRHATLFALDTDNTIIKLTTGSGSGTLGLYTGLHISGVKTLALTDPPPRQITHAGDDYVFAIMALPPNTAATGTLTTGKIDDDLEVGFAANKKVTIGQGTAFGIGTSNKGDEYYCCMLAYRQAVDTTVGSVSYGAQVWESRILPQVKLVGLEAGFSDQPEQKTYNLFPQICQQYPWGEVFNTNDEGFTSAWGIRFVTLHKPKLVSFHADGSATSFSFDADHPAFSTGTISMWINGTLTAPSTSSLTGITITPAPAESAKIIVLYETIYD